MVFSLYEACDGWWGKRYTEVWESQIYPLEDMAVKKIGDDAIDDAFEIVSAAIGDTVWEKFGEFTDRQRLGDELAVCDAYLADIDRQAQERFERLIEGMKQAQGITERLKEENALEWTRRLNNIRAYAREVIEREIIYI